LSSFSFCSSGLWAETKVNEKVRRIADNVKARISLFIIPNLYGFGMIKAWSIV